MRRVRILLVAILCAASTAAAEPQSKCFEGTETAKIGRIEKTFRAVLRRTIDPAASEIRQQAWSQKDPTKQKTIVYKVDAKANTFEAEDSDLGAKGTGTLVGKAWHWTSYSSKVDAKGYEFAVTGELLDDAVHTRGTISKAGNQVGTLVIDAIAFDCAKLDEHRAALK